jgi:hypothetical protein
MQHIGSRARRPGLACNRPDANLCPSDARAGTRVPILEGVCLIGDCTLARVAGEVLCAHHLARYCPRCESCGAEIKTELAMERSGNRFCTPCWYRTPDGIAFRSRIANAHRRSC